MLLRKLLLAYVLLSIAILCVQLIVEYRSYRQEIIDTLQSQANTMAPGAAVAIWDYQDDLLRSMVNGMGMHPVVVLVEITDKETGHRISWRAPGGADISASLQVSQPLQLTLANGTQRQVGTLLIASSEGHVWRHLRTVFFAIALDDALLLLSLAFVLWLLVHTLAVRPLSRFSAQVAKQSGKAPGLPIDLGRTDVAEIVTLQQGFNRMMREVGESHARIAEQNVELERKVAERTRDLEGKNRELVEAVARQQELTSSLKEAQVIAGLGSYVMDLRTGQIDTSDVLDQLFGIDGSYEHSVQGWLERIHPLDRKMIEDHFRNEVLGLGQDIDKEYRIVRFDDQAVRWLHGLGKLEFDAQGQPVRMRGTAQDITERVQAEERLRDSLRQLEEKELAKTRFLAAAGHDLRQPVAAANLFVEALKNTSPTPRQSEMIERLDHSMGIFSDLLEQLLDISRFDAGVIQPKLVSFDLAQIFAWLEHNFGQIARDKDLRFLLHFPMDRPLVVRTDIGLLQSVLMNLVSNAIKFTASGGVLLGVRRRGDSVLLQVWDTGIGIAEEDMPRIFDEFFQVANPQRNREAGLGLGLSICRRALKLMECDITCRSRLARGSVFELSLPLVAEQAEPELLPIGPAPTATADTLLASGRRVVVLEDDALVAGGMVNLLQGIGAEVMHFYNAEDALQHHDIVHADCYVVDYALGGTLTGLQFLETVQERLQAPIRAVVLTGETSSQFISKVADSPWPILHKPANYADLAAVLCAPVGVKLEY